MLFTPIALSVTSPIVSQPLFFASGVRLYGDQFSSAFSKAFAVSAYGPEFSTAFSSAFPSSKGKMFDLAFSIAFE